MSLFCRVVLSLLLARNADAKQVFNVKDPKFGAVDDGKTDSAKAIQRAFDATKEYVSQGGTDVSVLFPKTQKGFYFGPVQFDGLHNVIMEFEEGAQMQLLKSNKSWPLGGEHHIPWIQGSNSKNLTIQGGFFDGNGDWWGNTDKKIAHEMKRPRMIQLSGMTNLIVRDMTLHNAPTGHFSLKKSDWVEISHLTLDTPIATANTDGLGFDECHHVWVHDVFVQNGDDSIQASGSSDLLIEKGTIIGGHGLNFGGATSNLEVQDVTWRHLTLKDMHRGTRIKITPKTTGFIKNITYENLTMIRVEYPMGIQTDYGTDTTEEPLDSRSTKYTFGDIYWKNIHAVDGSHDGYGMGNGGGGPIKNPGQFNCTENAPCKHLHFSNVTIITHTPWVCKECDCSASKTVPDASICHLSPGPMPPPAPHPSPAPAPVPPPAPTPGSRCEEMDGFKCAADSHCQGKSTYGGDDDLKACAKRCSQDKSCMCFDHSTASSSGKYAACRLYPKAQMKASGDSYAAYLRESGVSMQQTIV